MGTPGIFPDNPGPRNSQLVCSREYYYSIKMSMGSTLWKLWLISLGHTRTNFIRIQQCKVSISIDLFSYLMRCITCSYQMTILTHNNYI